MKFFETRSPKKALALAALLGIMGAALAGCNDNPPDTPAPVVVNPGPTKNVTVVTPPAAGTPGPAGAPGAPGAAGAPGAPGAAGAPGPAAPAAPAAPASGTNP